MKGLALIVGAGGIGTQLAKDLNESEKDLDVVLCGRWKWKRFRCCFVWKKKWI